MVKGLDLNVVLLYQKIEEGKILVITLPNGTSMIISPKCLDKYYKIFSGETESTPDFTEGI